MLEISNQKVDKYEIEKNVYSLRVLSTPRTGRVLSYWLVGIIILLFLCLFLPWQQNVEGTGFVTALTPQDRPQEVQSAIAGRIKEWRIREGDFVNKGDTLVVLAEIKTDYFDPELLERTEEQINAKRQAIDANQKKNTALTQLIKARQTGLGLSLQKARNKYEQARLQVSIDSANFEAQKVKFNIAERQFSAYDTMFAAANNGEIPLISRTEYEKRKQKLQESRASVVEKQSKYLASQNKLINAKIELNSLEAEYADKIAKAQSDLSSSLASLADKESEYAKMRNKYANLAIRNDQYYVLAPQDGYVVKAKKSGIGETIKENDGLLTIQPAEPDAAVELYVKAMDVPLIAKGRHVRLEFDGWPALQVTGWPSVAVGTFGGTIQVIDYVDSKEGKYRILVVPDEREPWPKQIRVGSGVYGWIMLDDVPVWYEIWRQLNGFPPSLYTEPEEDEEKKGKKSDKKIKIKVK